MRIHGEGGNAEAHGQYDVGRFSAYTGERHEFVSSGWKPARVTLHNHSGKGADVSGLGAVKPHAPYDALQIGYPGPCEVREIRIPLEKARCHRIDLPVGGLCGEHNGNRELVWIYVFQRRPGVAVMGEEGRHDSTRAGRGHGREASAPAVCAAGGRVSGKAVVFGCHLFDRLRSR